MTAEIQLEDFILKCHWDISKVKHQEEKTVRSCDSISNKQGGNFPKMMTDSIQTTRINSQVENVSR